MQLGKSFDPWPTQIQLCENALNFKNDIEQKEQKLHFSQPLELLHGINPLSTDENERLVAEYTTLLLHGEHNNYNDKDIWYQLLTDENFYKNCKFVNRFAFKIQNRTLNESEVSSIEAVNTKKREVSRMAVEKLNFISANGPHPLMSESLVEDF